MLHAAGYRYRLHGDLPGRPDLVFPARRKVVFVHGCFWHGHDCPRGARTPKRNADYWTAKIARNVARDARAMAGLASLGWAAMVVWECRLRCLRDVHADLAAFLGPPGRTPRGAHETAARNLE